MKGEVVEITTLEDEYKVLTYRISIICPEKPDLKIGMCEIKQ